MNTHSHSYSYLFWTDAGNFDEEIPGSGKIERASMDGTERLAIITANVREPRSIVVDNPTGIDARIYWTDMYHGTVESADLRGGLRTTIIRESRMHCSHTVTHSHMHTLRTTSRHWRNTIWCSHHGRLHLLDGLHTKHPQSCEEDRRKPSEEDIS